jgi:hypothetical protein
MRTLALLTADGTAVANLIIGDAAQWPDAIDVTDIDPRPGPGWAYDGVAFAAPPPAPADAPVLSPRMTRLYLLNRYTAAERAAIRAARATDPVLDDAMYLFEQAQNVDVSLPLTQQLVGYLAQQGHIAAERVAEILAPAPLGEDGVLP